MQETKRARGVVAAFLVVFSGMFSAAIAHGQPQFRGEVGVLMELHSGRVLWERNDDSRLTPGSATKILTALVALEHSHLSDLVTVSERATAVRGNRIQLQAGEKLPMEDLLYALLLNSANDAAVAVAEHVAGSVGAFVKLMNEKAKQIGALNSHFLNPSGFADEGHYTTAKDLALIARASLHNAAFREIAAMTRDRLWRRREQEGTLAYQNKLLGKYEGVISINTCHAQEEAQCLVVAAERSEEAYVAVLLNARSQSVWQDLIYLLDYAFHAYARVELAERGDRLLTSVLNGEEVALAASATVHHLFAQPDPVVPRVSIVLDELEPPIAKGDKLGEVTFRNDREKIASVDLVSTVEVPERHSLLPLVAWIGWGLVGVLWVRLQVARRRQRYVFARRNRRLKL